MIMVESKLVAADNAGGILFTCIRIFGGFKRRYAGLGEMVGAVSSSRKVYRHEDDKLKQAKLAKKVKKKRKQKSKKVKPQSIHTAYPPKFKPSRSPNKTSINKAT